MKHHIFTIGLYNNDGATEINKYLCDGWLVKEMQITSDNECSYAVVLLEKEK